MREYLIKIRQARTARTLRVIAKTSCDALEAGFQLLRAGESASISVRPA